MLNITIDHVREELEELLQEALDNRNVEDINKWMEQIYPDYLKAYATTLIAYDMECDIHAADIINFHYLHPKSPFFILFCFEESRVKELCMGVV